MARQTKIWTQEELDALPRTRKEARAAGSTHYFTRKPCDPAKHVAARLASNGHCVECDREYQKTPAQREYRRTWESSSAQLEKRREYERKRYANDPDFKAKICAYEARLDVRARKQEQERARYANDPDFKAKMLEYQKRPDVRAKSREAQKRPDQRARMSLSQRGREHLLLKATLSWLTAEHVAGIAAIYAEAARLTEATGIEHQVDHVVPLKAKCLKTGERIACGLHVPWNLQPLPGHENRSKSCYFDAEAEAKAHWDWLTERGLTCDSRRAFAIAAE